jgi:VIT1/CCC1 family predicted Fe2+/Mn2+ transporter
MTIPSAHENEPHFITRSGWLRAAVLGANDGIVSISSLLVGVAAASPSARAVAIAGVAGVTAGAMSMAAGEYVSVSSQSDIERADIAREKQAIESEPDVEHAELVAIYQHRGLSHATAKLVAKELTQHDALGAHVRDELGLSEIHAANPLQAAVASGGTFTVAGSIPLLAALFAPENFTIHVVLAVTILALALLGYLGAKTGGAPIGPSLIRIVGWGIFAMAVTAGIGKLFGVSV